jgi:hypothetical protein
MRRHLTASLACTGLMMVLAACSTSADNGQVATAGGASSTAPTSSQPAAADSEERMRQFAACMREHGIDMPDPDPSKGGLTRLGGGKEDPKKMDAAMAACRSYMPDGGQPPRLSAEDLDKMRAMAACMREHGIDMPDPDPNNGGAILQQDNGGPPIDEKKLQAALEACRHLGPDLDAQVEQGGAR